MDANAREWTTRNFFLQPVKIWPIRVDSRPLPVNPLNSFASVLWHEALPAMRNSLHLNLIND